MAKISTGFSFKQTAKSNSAARMLALGDSEEEIVKVLWGLHKGEEGYVKAIRQLHKWKNDPNFYECFRAHIRERAITPFARSLETLYEQVEDNKAEHAWLRNKAANDVLNRHWGLMMGEDDNTIVVKVEGMPELGEPDGND